jgi:hypothetical protein
VDAYFLEAVMTVAVFDWDQRNFHLDSVGHCSMSLLGRDGGIDAHSYFSFHRKQSSFEREHGDFLGRLAGIALDVLTHGQPEFSKYDEDIERYESHEHEVIEGLDDDLISSLVDEFRHNTSQYYNLISNNCSTSVAGILKSAYAVVLHQRGLVDQVVFNIRNGAAAHIFGREDRHMEFNLIEFLEEHSIQAFAVARAGRMAVAPALLECANEVLKTTSWRPSQVMALARFINEHQ